MHLQTLTQKIAFQGAITTMGMGKTRILTDWSKEVWKHDDILEEFSSLNWIVTYKSYFNLTPALSPSLHIKHRNAQQPFKLTTIVVSSNMQPKDLAMLYLWELKDTVESSRYIGVKIQPGIFSSFSREQINLVLDRSALYSLFEAASSIQLQK